MCVRLIILRGFVIKVKLLLLFLIMLICFLLICVCVFIFEFFEGFEIDYKININGLIFNYV